MPNIVIMTRGNPDMHSIECSLMIGLSRNKNLMLG